MVLELVADKEAISKGDTATLSCSTNIGIPAVTMLSLIKNGENVTRAVSDRLEINTGNAIIVNPFGYYICLLNATGAIYRNSITIKAQGIRTVNI